MCQTKRRVNTSILIELTVLLTYETKIFTDADSALSIGYCSKINNFPKNIALNFYFYIIGALIYDY